MKVSEAMRLAIRHVSPFDPFFHITEKTLQLKKSQARLVTQHDLKGDIQMDIRQREQDLGDDIYCLDEALRALDELEKQK